MIRTFAARFAPAFLLILIALIGVPASAQDGGRVLESREFKSQILGRTVRYSVYLPAGYESNTTRHYPTVYLLHGMPFEPVNSETDWVQQGSADRLVGDAIASGRSFCSSVSTNRTNRSPRTSSTRGSIRPMIPVTRPITATSRRWTPPSAV